MRGDEDEVLARACASGDGAAWGELTNRYGGLVDQVVRRTARRQGITLGDADAEEMAAQVFASLVAREYRRLKLYDPRYPLGAYLRVIARSQVLDALRARRRRREAESEAYAPYSSVQPGDPLEQQELRGRLESVLRDLSAREASVIRLYFFADRTCPEIAALLRIPTNTVFSLLRRTTAKLAERIRRV